MIRLILAALLWASPALANTYAVQCAAGGCVASDGTLQPAGTVVNRIVAAPGTNLGPSYTLVPDTGQAIYAPPPSALTPAQQAAATLAAGLSITSPTLGLTGATFATLTDAVGNNVWTLILSELAALQQSGGTAFADGGATVSWPDAGGTLWTFTPAQFPTFAKAIGAFVAQCRNYANGKSGATLPSGAVILP